MLASKSIQFFVLCQLCVGRNFDSRHRRAPAPCRFPDKACSSMEAYSLLVSEACKVGGLQYYHGKNTLSYTACVLF